MKRTLYVGLVLVLAFAILLAGCNTPNPPPRPGLPELSDIPLVGKWFAAPVEAGDQPAEQPAEQPVDEAQEQEQEEDAGAPAETPDPYEGLEVYGLRMCEDVHPDLEQWNGSSAGICVDEKIQAATVAQGEIEGPVKGLFYVDPAKYPQHGYEEGKATFYPTTENAPKGQIEIPVGEVFVLDLPDGVWGLGGAMEVEEEKAEMPEVDASDVTSDTAEAPSEVVAVADPCKEYELQQIPDWSNGVCADAAFMSAVIGEGLIQAPVSGKLLILSDFQMEHCYGSNASFWPRTEGVIGEIPVPLDTVVTVQANAGKWGLGGATACDP